MKKLFFQSLVMLAIILSTSTTILAEEVAYKVNDGGDVVFTVMLEDLPLKATDIHKAATQYLSEAYKEARYEITECNDEKYIVVGKGKFNNFYQHNGLTSSELFSTTFHVRIDAKDSRARLQFIVSNYDVMNLNDLGNKKSESLVISKCSPINKALDNKSHRKAFEALANKADQVLSAIGIGLRKATPAVEEDSDW